MASLTWPRWMKRLLTDQTQPEPREIVKRVQPLVEILEDRAVPATFIVTNVLDNGVDSSFDGTRGYSLRQAIREANNLPGFDRITFEIPTNPDAQQTFSIRLATALPALTDAAGVSIDALTQPRNTALAGRPVVEITGAFLNPATSTDSGFELRPGSGNNVIRGFIINSFPFAGVNVVGSDNNIIVGNWIGTDLTGNSIKANGVGGGFQLTMTDGAANNVVGGITDLQGKPLVDAGGQLIGGTMKINRNVIGGGGDVRPGAGTPGEVISGPAIRIQDGGSENNLIQGNYLGVGFDGTSKIPNQTGIEVYNGAHRNFIGNPVTAGAGNLIANNTTDGVRVGPTPYPFGAQGIFPSSYDAYTPNYFTSREPIFTLVNGQGEIGSGVRGTTITITGEGFTGTQLVQVGGKNATFTVLSDKVMQVIIPTDAVDGPQQLLVRTPGGDVTSGSNDFVVLPSPPPDIDRFTQPTLTTGFATKGVRGAEVRIQGAGFLGTTGITFGGAPVTDFTVIDDANIRLTVPTAAATGPNLVTIATPGGTDSTDRTSTPLTYNVLASGLPAVTNFLDTSGPVGTIVKIFGSNFLAASQVKFNGVNAKSFTVNEFGTQILAVVPTLPVGNSGLISITGPGGTGTTSALLIKNFTVTASPAPVITSFTPGGVIGTRVGITGTGFFGATAVRFNGFNAASYTILSDTLIEAIVPTGATTGPITVVTPGGTASTSVLPIANFELLPSIRPQIPDITQDGIGPAGTQVRITGSGFSAATRVIFDGPTGQTEVLPYDGFNNPTGFRVNSVGTQITVRVPIDASLGENVITVESYGDFPTSETFPFPQNYTPAYRQRPSGDSQTTVTNVNGLTKVYGDTFFVTPAALPTFSTVPGNAFTPTTGTPGRLRIEDGFQEFDKTGATSYYDPNNIAAGTGVVTINGTGFTSVFDVEFVGANTVSTDFRVVSDTQIFAVVPNDTNASPGAYTIRLTSASGTIDSPTTFTIAAPGDPTIDVLGATQGRIGTRFTINGNNLTSTRQVTLGGQTARFRVENDSQLTVEVPTGLTKDLDYAISLTTAAKTVNSVGTFKVLAAPGGPSISTTVPFTVFGVNKANADVGTRISINGAGFTGNITGFGTDPGVRVNFTGPTDPFGNVVRVSGINPVVINDGEIQVTIPEGAISGAINILANTEGGTLATVPTPTFTLLSTTPTMIILDANPNGDPQNIQLVGNSIRNNFTNGAVDHRGIDFYNGSTYPNPYFSLWHEPDYLNDFDDADGITPSDPNRAQNYPLLQIAQTSIDRSEIPTALVARPFRNYRIDYYINSAAFGGNPDIGETYLASRFLTTDDQGFGSTNLILKNGDFADVVQSGSLGVTLPLPLGTILTATATDLTTGFTPGANNALVPNGDGTSRFSLSKAVSAATGAITGKKFNDLNRNGKFDTGEPGLPGFTIQLDLDNDGTIERTVVTDKNGDYQFSQATLGGVGLPNGTHRVTERNQPNFFPTLTPGLVTIINGESVNNVNFGNYQKFPPTAVDDAYTIGEDSPATTFDVLANDIVGNTQSLVITATTTTPNGTVTIAGDKKSIVFTPDANFVGTATFNYTISNGDLTDTGTVTVTVLATGTLPTAVDDAFTIGQDSGAQTFDVLANDTPGSAGPITITSTTTTPNGTVTIAADKLSVIFTPATGFVGTATFDYTITNPQGSDTATVTVTVLPAGSAPTANDDTFTVQRDSVAVPFDVLLNDTPGTGGALTITAVTTPTNGTVTIAGDGKSLIFTPDVGFTGTTVFNYTITNATGSDTATVTVNVVPPPFVPPFIGLGAISVVNGGSDGAVTVYRNDPATGTLLENVRVQPFGPFDGEIRVAIADVDGDLVDDVIAAAGPGGGPRVTVISGQTGQVIRDFFVYEPTYRGGIYVAAADLNSDGLAEIIVGADEGGGSRIRILDGATLVSIGDFFAYEESFRGGVRVSTGDFNGDGFIDIIAGAGYGGGPRVTIFDGRDLTGGTRLADYFAFEQSQRDGVYVAMGDINADGLFDPVVGAGPGGGPRVTVFDAYRLLLPTQEPIQLLNFFAFDENARTGVRVSSKKLDGDQAWDLVVGQGPGEGDYIKTYVTEFRDGTSPTPNQTSEFLLNNDFLSLKGVWVG